MKKTRILSLILAVLMLCGTASFFTSCAQKGEVKLSRKTVEVDLTEYTLVFADSESDKSISTTFKTVMGEFAATLGEATGVSYLANQESRTRSAASDPEILIGKTTRAESQEALDSIKGHGYTIQVINNKVVIVGTTNLLTLKAVQYFEENFLKAETVSPKLTLNVSAKCNKVEMITVADKENFYFSTVHSNTLDTDDGTDGGREVYYGVVNGTGRDYEFDLVQDTQTRIMTMMDFAKKVVSERTLTDKVDPVEHEIIIGTHTTREETAACRAELGTNEYGFFIRGGDIILTAWNAAGMQMCGNRFLDYLYECQYTDEDGNYSLVVPADLKLTGYCNENWVTEFPKPEGAGVELYTTAEGESNSLVYLYTGDGVNAAAYEAYCKKLLDEGFRVYGTQNAPENTDSVFTTFINKQDDIFIHASYNAYKYADLVDYPYDMPTIRIITAPLSDINLIDEKNLSARNVSKKVDSSITAIDLPSGSVGTGYVIMTEDGKFIILDGGAATTATNRSEKAGNLNTRPEHEIDNLYSILRDMYVKAFNREPDSNNPIEITGWFISHNHGDHTNVLWEFSKKFGTYGKQITYGKDKIQDKAYVTLDYVFCSSPASSRLYNTGEPSTFMIDYMGDLQKHFTKKEFTFVKLFTGQKLYFANLEMEVLFTNEDMVPQRIVTLNDSSTIVRFTLTPSDRDESGSKIKGDPVSFIFTGDAYVFGGRWCTAMYGDYMKADMVSMAHHGGPGTEEEFYDVIQPEYVWFPSRYGYKDNDGNYIGYLKQDNWYAKVDQHVCIDMECVKYIIFSAEYNTTLFIKVDGPAINDLYDAGKGVSIPNDAKEIVRK